MNVRHPTLVLSIPVLLGFFVSAGLCNAQQFHSTSYGYQLTLPPGWVEIPPIVLRQRTESMLDDTNSVIFDAGFRFESADEYPYFIVQVLPYAKYGLERQPNEDEFHLFVRGFSGLDVVELVGRRFTSYGRESIDSVEMGRAELDAVNRRYRWTSDVDYQEIGTIRMAADGYFGSQSIVQIMFYSRPIDWGRHSDVRRAIFDSFRFDPERAYRSPPSNSSGDGLIGVVVARVHFTPHE